MAFVASSADEGCGPEMRLGAEMQPLCLFQLLPHPGRVSPPSNHSPPCPLMAACSPFPPCTPRPVFARGESGFSCQLGPLPTLGGCLWSPASSWQGASSTAVRPPTSVRSPSGDARPARPAASPSACGWACSRRECAWTASGVGGRSTSGDQRWTHCPSRAPSLLGPWQSLAAPGRQPQ